MYKQDLTLNNLQWLICHETKPKTHTHNINESTYKFIFHYLVPY